MVHFDPTPVVIQTFRDGTEGKESEVGLVGLEDLLLKVTSCSHKPSLLHRFQDSMSVNKNDPHTGDGKYPLRYVQINIKYTCDKKNHGIGSDWGKSNKLDYTSSSELNVN